MSRRNESLVQLDRRVANSSGTGPRKAPSKTQSGLGVARDTAALKGGCQEN